MNKFEIGNKKTIYKLSHDDDPIAFYSEILRDLLIHQGFTINQEIEKTIKDMATEQYKKITEETAAKGIPEYLSKIFNFKKKGEFEKYFNSTEILEEDFYLLSHNHMQIGLKYEKKFHKYYPEHLKIHPNEISGKTYKVGKKISEIFKQRRHLCIHHFQKDAEWYCFFFDFQDLGVFPHKTHWQGGSHIHFVSSHWGLQIENIFEQFESKRVSLPKLHIKFKIHQ